MKARIENNKIQIYNNIPTKFKGLQGFTVGGYEKMSDEIHKSDGFYDVIEPEYDNIIQELNNIYFDVDNECFTYQIINIPYNIDVERTKKINELKILSNEFFSNTDWYYIREIRKGVSVPSNVQNESDLMYNKIDEIEEEINNLSSVREILIYEINLDS